MNYDYIHLAIWLLLGIFLTWGIFFSWVGYRDRAREGKSVRLATYASNASFVIGVLWIMIWVSMVVVNIYQIVGDPSWHPTLPR